MLTQDCHADEGQHLHHSPIGEDGRVFLRKLAVLVLNRFRNKAVEFGMAFFKVY